MPHFLGRFEEVYGHLNRTDRSTPLIPADSAFTVLELGGQDKLKRNLRETAFQPAALVILPSDSLLFRADIIENR